LTSPAKVPTGEMRKVVGSVARHAARNASHSPSGMIFCACAALFKNNYFAEM